MILEFQYNILCYQSNKKTGKIEIKNNNELFIDNKLKGYINYHKLDYISYEIIQYSIPDVNYVKSPENYEKLCETLSSISKDNKTTELEGLIFLAKKI